MGLLSSYRETQPIISDRIHQTFTIGLWLQPRFESLPRRCCLLLLRTDGVRKEHSRTCNGPRTARSLFWRATALEDTASTLPLLPRFTRMPTVSFLSGAPSLLAERLRFDFEPQVAAAVVKGVQRHCGLKCRRSWCVFQQQPCPLFLAA